MGLKNKTYMALENKKLGPRVGPKIQRTKKGIMPPIFEKMSKVHEQSEIRLSISWVS